MTDMNNRQVSSRIRTKKRRDPAYDDVPAGKGRLLKRIMIFVMALTMPTLLWGCTGLIGLNDKLDFDTYENRNKHEFAEELSLGI